MTQTSPNPFLTLNYEPALEGLGADYFDEVAAAEFPTHILRFRNDQLLPLLGLNPETVTDNDFIEAFGKFQGVRPFLALRYHGYQFGEYNSFLGDGRGFLYGQVRGTDGALYDFGTKGSGRTPYSRSADGRLTLKGGVREVLAAEALHNLGVNTSRCLSLIETGESLWRGDEPSPTRSSVMIRFSRSHIRFGTFERLHYFKRPDLIKKLLDHVINIYYPQIGKESDRYVLFYSSLVERVALLAAQWMGAGFCHGVLNTDNMSITGESFDYGPYAFIPTYDPQFTAAYFDYGGRYSYGNQPFICRLNLEMLQTALASVIPFADNIAGLERFDELYELNYRQLMLQKLGFASLEPSAAEELLYQTIKLLMESKMGYHGFFAELAIQFNYGWREDSSTILENTSINYAGWKNWQNLYHQILNNLPQEEMEKVGKRLSKNNPKTVLFRPLIESVWEAITQEDDWSPFKALVSKLQAQE
ncbi:MAG: YdiU family protein [Gomphosphaeria aponina SAG 52.96 = DSM 107014]|uniref:Protein nucleotidyltransferase YdiU n=1 Tax=Gomphosphaeria aponina SAG 52.96 = DSM 107014 TaxID=1521640 RepID=A0A941GW56_9CHRO|nr:YdiU family protein [Gomphosphaeria aponina SAG 52.96 = DSM 107014]